MEIDAFVQDFLTHVYDPAKAHDYYLRVRKLKGRAGVQKDAQAKAYETGVVNDAHKQLLADLKNTKVKMNPNRRINAAEQKLIRAKSLAARIKDPTVKADMLAKIAAAEQKLHAVKLRHRVLPPHHKANRTKKVAPSAPKAKSTTFTKGRSHENQQ